MRSILLISGAGAVMVADSSWRASFGAEEGDADLPSGAVMMADSLPTGEERSQRFMLPPQALDEERAVAKMAMLVEEDSPIDDELETAHVKATPWHQDDGDVRYWAFLFVICCYSICFIRSLYGTARKAKEFVTNGEKYDIGMADQQTHQRKVHLKLNIETPDTLGGRTYKLNVDVANGKNNSVTSGNSDSASEDAMKRWMSTLPGNENPEDLSPLMPSEDSTVVEDRAKNVAEKVVNSSPERFKGEDAEEVIQSKINHKAAAKYLVKKEEELAEAEAAAESQAAQAQ